MKINGYQFKDPKLLERALTHSSKSPENYERLEYLGDCILNFLVGEYLFKNSKEHEGMLTKLRAHYVSESFLSTVFDSLNITDSVIVGRCFQGEITRAIKCDVYEAIIASLYLDGGIDVAKKFILETLNLNDFETVKLDDYKTSLQEAVQSEFKCKFSYKTFKEGDMFISEFYLEEDKIADGKGTNKTEAEQNVAKKALEILFVEK